MPYNPDGSFSLLQGFGTGTPPNNQFPPQVGATLADIATALGDGSPNNPYLTKANNLSDVASVLTSRANLGVAIGVNVQAFDPQLSSNIPQNSQSAAYTTVLTDGEKQIYHPSADTTARIWTIDSNVNVPYPVGTALTFINDLGAGVITLAITADTLVQAGTGFTGSRTLSAAGMATAVKTAPTRWIISGSGLS